MLLLSSSIIFLTIACSSEEEIVETIPPQQKQVQQNPVQQVTTTPSKKQPLPPLNPVGTGVFTKKAPEQKSNAETGAICPNCNIILVTFCSLRKDHVSLYDSEFDITP